MPIHAILTEGVTGSRRREGMNGVGIGGRNGDGNEGGGENGDLNGDGGGNEGARDGDRGGSDDGEGMEMKTE